MDNSISFQSRIRFVDHYEFYKTVGRNVLNLKNIEHDGEYIMRTPLFRSSDIKTCTGGGLVAPHREACGFHIFHGEYFNRNMDKVFNKDSCQVPAERALIIGGKKRPNAKYSLPNFRKIRKIISQRVKYISEFKEHRYKYSKTDFHYSLDNDTWTILTQYAPKDKYLDVTSLKQLKKVFKKIKIADGDKLFIQDKEILPTECPRIFSKKRVTRGFINKLEQKFSKLFNG